MNNKATLYLIPIPVAEDANETLSMELIKVVPTIKYFFVENLRTARRFLKSVDKAIDIDACHFIEIDKHNGIDYKTFKDWLKEGRTIGIMSEAGCPGVADPGAVIVKLAHEKGIQVINEAIEIEPVYDFVHATGMIDFFRFTGDSGVMPLEL